MVTTSLIILGILAALAGGVAVYEYENNQSNLSNVNQTGSQAAQTGVTNPDLPPLLYDPIINGMPNPAKDVSLLNPVVYNDEYPSTSSGTTVVVPASSDALVASQKAIAQAKVDSQIAATTASVQNYLSTVKNNNAANSQKIASTVAQTVDNLIAKVGPLSQSEIDKIGYSAGTAGYSTVPVLNSNGKVISMSVVDVAKSLAAPATTGEVVTSAPGSGSVNSISSVSAPKNTVIGYSSTGIGNQQAKTYSAASGFNGAGEYVSSTGVSEYVSSASQYNQQVRLGYLGSTSPKAGSAAAGNTAQSYTETNVPIENYTVTFPTSTSVTAKATPANSNPPAKSTVVSNKTTPTHTANAFDYGTLIPTSNPIVTPAIDSVSNGQTAAKTSTTTSTTVSTTKPTTTQYYTNTPYSNQYNNTVENINKSVQSLWP